jgi:hypothetical protein
VAVGSNKSSLIGRTADGERYRPRRVPRLARCRRAYHGEFDDLVVEAGLDTEVVAEGAGFAPAPLPPVAGLLLAAAGPVLAVAGLLLADAGLLLADAGLLLAVAGLLLAGAGLLFSDLVGDGELLGAGELEVGVGLGDEVCEFGWLVVWLGAVTSRGGCTW